jgi:hypothetical protein
LTHSLLKWLVVAAVFAIALLAATSALADKTGVSGIPSVAPQPIDASQFSPSTTTIGGGADVIPTTRTITHWWGSAMNPQDGITYGFNMVGADPNHCSGSGCSVTIQADITPLIVNFDGMTYDGTAVLGPTLASPQFVGNDYGSTPAATAAGNFPLYPSLVNGPGGTLSQGDKGLSLQLEDATMRAQFNKVGRNSPYHLILHPNVLPAVTIDVPQNQGVLYESPQGVIFPTININWWAAQIQNLERTADPTHLPIYLTNDVLLKDQFGGCCTIGFHGTRASGYGTGDANSNGNAVVQTFAWASWVRPGTYPRVAGRPLPTQWALQDIHALSHEIAEWADDPFVNNTVDPWLTPTAPQYGCTNVLETGDPVVAIGFAMGHNTFEQGALPDGEQMADGYYHPEDEVFMPWFMRLAPNLVSEPTQTASTNIGRYTLMGDLNPFPGFRAPATSC